MADLLAFLFEALSGLATSWRGLLVAATLAVLLTGALVALVFAARALF